MVSNGKCESESGLVTNHLQKDRWKHLSSWLELELPPKYTALQLILLSLTLRESETQLFQQQGLFSFCPFDPLRKSQSLKEVIGSRRLVGVQGKKRK